MTWTNQLKGDSTAWLLDSGDAGVRYLALRDLADLPKNDPQLLAARKTAHESGPIAGILSHMEPEGYWVEPGAGYRPKYNGTVWSVILLAQLGASPEEDERISLACNYLLDHALTAEGSFSISGTPSGTVDCLQGNLCWALRELGCRDERLDRAFEWMARSVTGEDSSSPNGEGRMRYYAYKCGPYFACGANGRQPCAWGAVKVLLALSGLERRQQTAAITRAIPQGITFLFSVDPAKAAYPTSNDTKPSRNWWKFGFPVFYVTDLLQLAEALVNLGCRNDARLDGVIEIIRQKQDALGRWALEYDYCGKTWEDFGETRQPNPWVTLRALRVLKKLDQPGQPVL